jgi:hypothetical protein
MSINIENNGMKWRRRMAAVEEKSQRKARKRKIINNQCLHQQWRKWYSANQRRARIEMKARRSERIGRSSA